MTKPFVAILMGSENDLPIMEITRSELNTLSVPHEIRILSAHRTPQLTMEYIKEADKRGCAVFIAAAGMAAHLAGAVAAHTLKPVIGVPLEGNGFLHGLDALLSTVQMPGGMPVACVTVGKAGAKNAAVLATQILAIHDKGLAKKLETQRLAKQEAIKKVNEDL